MRADICSRSFLLLMVLAIPTHGEVSASHTFFDTKAYPDGGSDGSAPAMKFR
jgi:hypothetical protein